MHESICNCCYPGKLILPLLAVLILASICHADMPGPIASEDMGFSDELFSDFFYVVLIVFLLAQLIETFIEWSFTRKFTNSATGLFILLFLMNLVTPLFVMALLQGSGNDVYITLIPVEIMVIFMESGLIKLICRSMREKDSEKILPYHRALLASFAGNAASLLFGLGLLFLIDATVI